ncbi:MAG: sulfatase [Planctomycetaceae bacterium]|nr:sulfatase [Planctomycetaceae bacterium]
MPQYDFVKRSLIVGCLLLLMHAVACPEGIFANDRRTTQPNVIIFLADDLGAMDIGANNPNTFYETPNVDRLATEGINFTQGYAACCVCSPTRLSMMTGKYPARTGATDWFSSNRSERFNPAPLHNRMELDEFTIAKAFREAGYKTAHIGKWHLGPTPEFWAENQGFDVNIGGFSQGSPPSWVSPYRNPRLEDGPEGEFLTERLAQEAVDFIKKTKDSPFLIHYSFYQVHTPLWAPEALVQKYRDKAQALGLPTANAELFAPEDQHQLTDNPRLVRVRQTHAVYAAMVEAMDTAVGRVVEALREEGLLENTIICFMSDNGGLSTSEGSPTSNAQLRAGKGWQYEGGIRVPFIIRVPGIAGQVSECPVITNDIFPTMLELAGLPPRPAQHLDGVSLAPIFAGKETVGRERLYWHYPHYSNQGGFPGGAVREGDWKMIRHYEEGRVSLYNLKDDPSERNDLAASEPLRANDLAAKHDLWLKSVGAKFLQERNGHQPWKPE